MPSEHAQAAGTILRLTVRVLRQEFLVFSHSPEQRFEPRSPSSSSALLPQTYYSNLPSILPLLSEHWET